MTGILPIARQLGSILDCKPIEQAPQIAGPTRPSRGRWPADVWAEMQAIYATPDPLEQHPIRHTRVQAGEEERK